MQVWREDGVPQDMPLLITESNLILRPQAKPIRIFSRACGWRIMSDRF